VHENFEEDLDLAGVEAGARTAAVVDRGRSFATGLRDCVADLPAGIEASDAPGTLAPIVDRVHHLESRCDELAREIRRLVAAGIAPTFAGAYLVADDLVAVVSHSDVVASRAERFLTQLAAIDPDLSRTERVAFRKMATLAAEATTVFSRALEAYLLRVATGESVDVAYSLDRVRALERDCDDRKYAFLERTFADGTDPAALVRKDLVTALDGVTNAAEDAADELIAVASFDVGG